MHSFKIEASLINIQPWQICSLTWNHVQYPKCEIIKKQAFTTDLSWTLLCIISRGRFSVPCYKFEIHLRWKPRKKLHVTNLCMLKQRERLWDICWILCFSYGWLFKCDTICNPVAPTKWQQTLSENKQPPSLQVRDTGQAAGTPACG